MESEKPYTSLSQSRELFNKSTDPGFRGSLPSSYVSLVIYLNLSYGFLICKIKIISSPTLTKFCVK